MKDAFETFGQDLQARIFAETRREWGAKAYDRWRTPRFMGGHARRGWLGRWGTEAGEHPTRGPKGQANRIQPVHPVPGRCEDGISEVFHERFSEPAIRHEGIPRDRSRGM